MSDKEALPVGFKRLAVKKPVRELRQTPVSLSDARKDKHGYWSFKIKFEELI